MDEREIIGVVENHNQAIVGNKYKKGVKPNEITPDKVNVKRVSIKTISSPLKSPFLLMC